MMSNMPLNGSIPVSMQDKVYDYYIDLLVQELEINGDGHYILPMSVTLVHAQKPKE